MSEVWGALAQSSPAATTLTAAYTVPSGKRATIEVMICNRAALTTVRLSHAINGAADALSQYLLYGFEIEANNAVSTARFTVTSGDVVRVYSTSGSVTFQINGIEENGA